MLPPTPTPDGVGSAAQTGNVHDFDLSPDGAHVATIESNDLTPPELYLLAARGGTEQRITRSPPKEFYAHQWVKPRYVAFKSRIGFTLRARIIEPPNLDRAKKYPVVFGPVYSNTARNDWRGARNTYAQMEALAGKYINVQVDLRGSMGYGVDFREAFQGDWAAGISRTCTARSSTCGRCRTWTWTGSGCGAAATAA